MKKLPGTNVCQYLCDGTSFVYFAGNPSPGYYCPPTSGVCTVAGDEIVIPALPIPPEATRSLALNQGEYLFNQATKKLMFRSGKSGPGRSFPVELSVKELAKIDEKAAELVKSIQKNKSIASFSVILKAQKNA